MAAVAVAAAVDVPAEPADAVGRVVVAATEVAVAAEADRRISCRSGSWQQQP